MGNQEIAPNMALMANMLAQIQAQAIAASKQGPIAAVDSDANNIVKKEPIDSTDGDAGGGDFDPTMFLAMAMNA